MEIYLKNIYVFPHTYIYIQMYIHLSREKKPLERNREGAKTTKKGRKTYLLGERAEKLAREERVDLEKD